MTQKLVDGVLVDLTPEEEAEFQKQQNTAKVGIEQYSNGPTIAELFGEKVNVKS